VAEEFVTVIVNVPLSPAYSVGAAKLCVTVAVVMIVSAELDVGTKTLPAPVVEMVDAPDELLPTVPASAMAVLTVIVQLPLAAATAPVNVSVLPLAATVPAVPPLQLTLGAPNVIAFGPDKVSVKLEMLRVLVVDRLLIVMGKVDGSPGYTDVGENAWVIVTGVRTVRLAAVGVPVTPLVFPIAPGVWL